MKSESTLQYHEKKRRVKLDLNRWLSNDDRSSFRDFVEKNKFGDRFGFDEKAILKMFQNFFPSLTIDEDGQPIKRYDNE